MARRSALLFVLVTLSATIGGGLQTAAAGPPQLPPPKPVTFSEEEWGSVRPEFHARHDSNRVFYAGSLKQARRWATFTSLPYNRSPYDFTRYGVLAIFYKGDWAGFTPEVQTVAESAGGDLYAKVTLQYFCHFPMICPPPPHGPDPQPWGMYIVLLLDKSSLGMAPQSVTVTTAVEF